MPGGATVPSGYAPGSGSVSGLGTSRRANMPSSGAGSSSARGNEHPSVAKHGNVFNIEDGN